MNILLFIVIVLFVIWIVICLYIYRYQESFIFKPNQIKIDEKEIDDVKEHEFEINKDEVKLKGWYKKSGPDLIIYYGGTGENILYHFNYLSKIDKNYSLLFIYYRGYFESKGKPDEKNIYNDCLYIYDNVVKKDNYKKIIIIGRSLGCAVASYVAVHRKIDSLILVSPFKSVVNLAYKKFPFIPMGILLKHRFSTQKYAPFINNSTLILIAENDKNVPSSNSMKLAKAIKDAEVKVIHNSDHTTIKNSSEYWNTILSFLTKQTEKIIDAQ